MNLALELIPLERREGARSALAATFGSSPVSEPQPLHGGASAARIYRVDHEARAYVLRLDHYEVGYGVITHRACFGPVG